MKFIFPQLGGLFKVEILKAYKKGEGSKGRKWHEAIKEGGGQIASCEIRPSDPPPQ